VFIITYADAKDDSVDSQILDKISEYFLNLNKVDRIPKSDVVQELSSISDIHSVDITFLSRKNEEYHRQNPTVNASSMVGLDSILGDIIFEPSEVPIIRGGWFDRNNFYYSEDVKDSGLKSVNIIRKGTVDSTKRQKI
jgi:hypothetical protein